MNVEAAQAEAEAEAEEGPEVEALAEKGKPLQVGVAH